MAGGEPRKMSIMPSPDMFPVDLSPDGSELLVVDGHGRAAARAALEPSDFGWFSTPSDGCRGRNGRVVAGWKDAGL